jgi:hypothetical protein
VVPVAVVRDVKDVPLGQRFPGHVYVVLAWLAWFHVDGVTGALPDEGRYSLIDTAVYSSQSK